MGQGRHHTCHVGLIIGQESRVPRKDANGGAVRPMRAPYYVFGLSTDTLELVGLMKRMQVTSRSPLLEADTEVIMY